MGADDLHKKRLQKISGKLKRQSKLRPPYTRVLIICEGEKTEPTYFNNLIKDLGLNPVNIQIKGNNGKSDPLSIIEFALEIYNKDKDYDHIFCVFDKDQHSNYMQALEKIKGYQSRRKSVPIEAITSVPCFEFWLLLHFDETSAPYRRKGKKSEGEQIVSKLKEHIKDYSKGFEETFERTKAHIDKAVSRAKKIEAQHAASNTDNPSTQVYKLVEFLYEQKR